jgi:hypothetical protein
MPLKTLLKPSNGLLVIGFACPIRSCVVLPFMPLSCIRIQCAAVAVCQNGLAVAGAHTSQGMLSIGLLCSLCLWVVGLGVALGCCMQGQPCQRQSLFASACMLRRARSVALLRHQRQRRLKCVVSVMQQLCIAASGNCLLFLPSHTINNTAGHAPASACGSGIASSMLLSLLAQLPMDLSTFTPLRYALIVDFTVWYLWIYLPERLCRGPERLFCSFLLPLVTLHIHGPLCPLTLYRLCSNAPRDVSCAEGFLSFSGSSCMDSVHIITHMQMHRPLHGPCFHRAAPLVMCGAGCTGVTACAAHICMLLQQLRFFYYVQSVPSQLPLCSLSVLRLSHQSMPPVCPT